MQVLTDLQVACSWRDACYTKTILEGGNITTTHVPSDSVTQVNKGTI